MDEEVAPHQQVDDAKGQAETAAYVEKTQATDGPTGEEPVTDVDGREVPMSEMPANGVWPGQEGDLADREGEAGDVDNADVVVELPPDATEEELERARQEEQARLDAEDAQLSPEARAARDAQAERERLANRGY